MTGPTGRRDLLAALHPITRAFRRVEDAAAAREGLSMWQYAILSVVAERPGANQNEIATYLQYSPNRIVADLHDLETRGWLTRRPGTDRRANLLAPTDAGEAVRLRIQAEIHRGEDALLDGLTAEQRASFDVAARELARLVRARDRPTGPRRPPGA
jgi:DNA-binding MarR family transcriptional regulator